MPQGGFPCPPPRWGYVRCGGTYHPPRRRQSGLCDAVSELRALVPRLYVVGGLGGLLELKLRGGR